MGEGRIDGMESFSIGIAVDFGICGQIGLTGAGVKDRAIRLRRGQ